MRRLRFNIGSIMIAVAVVAMEIEVHPTDLEVLLSPYDAAAGKPTLRQRHRDGQPARGPRDPPGASQGSWEISGRSISGVERPPKLI
jgi:hypothetical protein